MSTNPPETPDLCKFTKETFDETLQTLQNFPEQDVFSIWPCMLYIVFFSVTLFALRHMILSNTKLFSLK